MILDTIDHANQYAGLNIRLDTALNAMKVYTPDNYPGGRIALDGEKLFLLLNSYETHPAENALCEAHRQYLDVMYMVEGEEIIYVKPTERLLTVTKPYSAEIDALLGETDMDATPVRLAAGSFIVLFPQDAHTPACYTDGPHLVKKIIGKVALD